MKKLFIILLFVVSAEITSCGYDTPVIDGKEPFVVEKASICHSNDFKGMCKYYSNMGVGGKDNFLGFWEPCIIAPTGKYTTGDTITFKK